MPFNGAPLLARRKTGQAAEAADFDPPDAWRWLSGSEELLSSLEGYGFAVMAEQVLDAVIYA